jgi:HD-like signal output (HDOD) protein
MGALSSGGSPAAFQMDYKSIDYKGIPVQADIIAGIIRLQVDAIDCFRELDRLVRSDQGVASLVLMVVNSPLYNRGRMVASIPLAISVLGFNVVRSLAMLAFARSLFSQTKDPLFRRHIWQHSLLTAIASHGVCHALGNATGKDDAFIAGLMHDTGKVLLFTHARERYLEALNLCLESGCASAEAERRFLGTDHYQVGREAVAQWKLPQRFVEYMATDLSVPSAAAAADTVRLSLAAANYLVKALGIGSRPIDDSGVRNSALMALGVGEALAEKLVDSAFLEALFENDIYKLCADF